MTYRDEGGRWSSYSGWYVLLLFWVGLGWWVVASLGNSAFIHSFWYQYTWSYIQYVTFQTLYRTFCSFQTFGLSHAAFDTDMWWFRMCQSYPMLRYSASIWIFIIDCIWWNKGHIVVNVCICICIATLWYMGNIWPAVRSLEVREPLKIRWIWNLWLLSWSRPITTESRNTFTNPFWSVNSDQLAKDGKRFELSHLTKDSLMDTIEPWQLNVARGTTDPGYWV